MRSAVLHISASVIVAVLVFAGVSSMPRRLENANFVAGKAVHDIQRRAPVHLPAVHNVTTSCNKSDASSPTCNTTVGFTDRVKTIIGENVAAIYRAMIVLGSISAIVLVYISFRYFR